MVRHCDSIFSEWKIQFKICNQLQITNTMADIVCTEESELLPNLDDDLLDAEVSALFHNYLQMSEVRRTFIILPYPLNV